MKHRLLGKKFDRTRQQRKALFKSLISSLIRHGSIETTEGKAKAVRPIIDKLVTKARQASLSSHRQIHAFLQDKEATRRLVKDIAPSYKRRSGFTRIWRTLIRRGDAAKMVKLEWIKNSAPAKPSPPAEKIKTKPGSKTKK